MSISSKVKKELERYIDPKKAEHFPRFFKTGKGEYGEGDKFIGVTVPNQRTVAKEFFKEATLGDVQSLLESPIHEHRLTALIILVYKYQKEKSEEAKKEIVDFYLKNTKYVNNWDLVDTSAAEILGNWLLKKPNKEVLYELAKSEDLWKERIAIIASYAFIKKEQFEDTLKIATILLHHEHDLIHKAVGWMLREVGKRNQEIEENFLKKYYKTMPRTMLRYAIEKFEKEKRQQYLMGEI